MSNGDDWADVKTAPTDEWEDVKPVAPTRQRGESRNLSQAEVDKFSPKTALEKQREGSGRGWWEHTKQATLGMLPKPPQTLGEAFTDAAKLTPLALPFTTAAKGAEAAGGAHEAYTGARERGHDVPYSLAAGVNAPLGVNAERMERAADVGDTGGVLGEATPSAAMAVAPLAGEAAGRLGAAAKPRLAEMVRTPKNALTPGTRAISRAGGFVAGMGLAPVAKWEGGLVGAALGPTVADWVLPERAIPPETIRTTPFEGATSTAAPSGSAQLPAVPKGSPTRFPTVEPKARLGSARGSILGGGEEAPGRIIRAGERVDPLKVESAGSAAQATEGDLRKLARWGDESAARELTRRRLPPEPRAYSSAGEDYPERPERTESVTFGTEPPLEMPPSGITEPVERTSGTFGTESQPETPAPPKHRSTPKRKAPGKPE